MESQPQNPEFRNNPEKFHPCTCCFDSTARALHMSKPKKPLSKCGPSFTSSSLDLMVAKTSGLILQICLIAALSFYCKGRRFGLFNRQVSLAWNIKLHKPER